MFSFLLEAFILPFFRIDLQLKNSTSFHSFEKVLISFVLLKFIFTVYKFILIGLGFYLILLFQAELDYIVLFSLVTMTSNEKYTAVLIVFFFTNEMMILSGSFQYFLFVIFHFQKYKYHVF